MSEYLPGIDVSGWQLKYGPIDWDKLAAGGLKFAILKASQGRGYQWAQFWDQRDEVRKRGITLGVYHFADMAHTPEDNAANFAATIGTVGGKLDVRTGDIFPVLDFEGAVWDYSQAERTDWLLRFAAAWKQYCPHPLILYGKPDHIRTPELLAAYPYLWKVHWEDDEPQGPFGLYNTWAIWQWRGDSGRIDGVVGPCDQDRTTPERMKAITVRGIPLWPFLLGGGILVAALSVFLIRRRRQRRLEAA